MEIFQKLQRVGGLTGLVRDINVHKERCPRCASRGQDTSGDNLAVYEDGHAHCYACQYHKGTDVSQRLYQAAYPFPQSDPTHKALDFPEDVSYTLPEECMRWLRGYNIFDNEIKRHNMCWSPSQELLIFPVFNHWPNSDGNPDELAMWIGRSFQKVVPIGSKLKPKYIKHGHTGDILHWIGKPTKEVILVEDLISAIKVGRYYQAMPLWGSHVSLTQIDRLSRYFERVGIWLDRDKLDHSIRLVLRASQIVPTFLVSTEFDPKVYAGDAIANIISTSQRNLCYKESVPETPNLAKAVALACQSKPYVQVCMEYPSCNIDLAEYLRLKALNPPFDNVSENEVRGPYDG